MLPLQQHSHSIETEQIAPLERAGPVRHFGDIHSAGVRGPDESADTGARDDRRLDPELVERAKDTDVGEAFEAAAAEDERYPRRFAPRFAGRHSFQTAWSLAGHAKRVCGKL